MTECRAEVKVTSFTGEGNIKFQVHVSGCEKSSGRFEYNAVIDNGIRKSNYNRRLEWNHSSEDRIEVDDSIDLSVSERVVEVEVDRDTIDCICVG